MKTTRLQKLQTLALAGATAGERAAAQAAIVRVTRVARAYGQYDVVQGGRLDEML